MSYGAPTGRKLNPRGEPVHRLQRHTCIFVLLGRITCMWVRVAGNTGLQHKLGSLECTCMPRSKSSRLSSQTRPKWFSRALMMASRTRGDRSCENCPFSSWCTATHLCNHTRTVNKILGESELGGETCLEHVSTKAGEELRKVKAGCCVANGFLWMLQQCLQVPYYYYLLDHAESTTIATTTTTRTTITRTVGPPNCTG